MSSLDDCFVISFITAASSPASLCTSPLPLHQDSCQLRQFRVPIAAEEAKEARIAPPPLFLAAFDLPPCLFI